MLPTVDRALLSMYLRPEWRRAVSLSCLLLIGIALQLAGPQLIKVFIDEARSGESFQQLVWISAAFLSVALLTQVAAVFETRVAEDLGWRTTNALRADLTRHTLNLDSSFHAQYSPGELIERIDGDVSVISDFFARFVVQILGSGIFLAGVLALLWVADWRVGLLLTGFSAGALVYMSRAGTRVATTSAMARKSAADLSGYIQERLEGLPDIKSNGADTHVLSGLHVRLADRYRTSFASARAATLFLGNVSGIFAVATGAALALGAVLHNSGAISLGTVFLVFRYTSMLQLPLERLSTQMNTLQQATGGIVRVRQLLETEANITEGAGHHLPAGAFPVEFDSVSFAYEDAPVLHNVSFSLAAGEVLGLLGRTGSGKTTISRLLFRLQDAGQGAIRFGGLDIRDVLLDDLRQHVGMVTQDVQLFQGTIRDNVALFDPSVGDGRLIETFDVLGLGEWLRSLPAGLDTLLGAGGRGISAGEAQLIAAARVFLKNPGLVILDEASSRLDPLTERFLEHAISRLLAGRTAVVIAHRLSTVERADRIVILEDGAVAESGPRFDLEGDRNSRLSQLLRAGEAEMLA